MSHISKIEVQINDLKALENACDKLGLKFLQNKKSFAWYNGRGKCTHAISVPGASYEIGVVQKGNAYELLWDDWHSGGLGQKLGKNASRLIKEYSMERVKIEARKKRYRVQEQNIENGTRLILSV